MSAIDQRWIVPNARGATTSAAPSRTAEQELALEWGATLRPGDLYARYRDVPVLRGGGDAASAKAAKETSFTVTLAMGLAGSLATILLGLQNADAATRVIMLGTAALLTLNLV